MKIRHPWLITAAALAGAWVIRGWMATLRFRYRPLGRDVDPRQAGLKERYIYAFWHENMLLPAYLYGRDDISVLISRHADGQLIAEICRRLGFRTVRGSTTRGGVEAMRQMQRVTGHVAITPDGPRGPRRRVQPGLIYLAARTGLPIVPGGIGYAKAWRMNSWDRFVVPLPFSRAAIVTAEPIHVPADLDREQLEQYRLLVERRLEKVTARAEALAGCGWRITPGGWPEAEAA